MIMKAIDVPASSFLSEEREKEWKNNVVHLVSGRFFNTKG